MVHTIIFDVGDTLVEAPHLLQTIDREIQRLYGISIYDKLRVEFNNAFDEVVFRDVKTTLTAVTGKILDKARVDGKDIDIAALYIDNFLNKSILGKDSLHILQYLKRRNITLIAVSDADADVMIPELKKLKIYPFFNKIVISSDVRGYKPSTQMVSSVASLLKQPFEGILFVGDSENDMLTAKALGVRSVLYGKGKESAHADLNITTLLELKPLIR